MINNIPTIYQVPFLGVLGEDHEQNCKFLTFEPWKKFANCIDQKEKSDIDGFLNRQTTASHFDLLV